MVTLFYHKPDPVGHRPTRHTPQLPPYPMVTVPPSTITGTSRLPFVREIISAMAADSFWTFRYTTSAPAFS